MENQQQNKFLQSEQEKETLIQNLSQARSRIIELEKQVKEAEYEEIAHNVLLEEKRKEKQALEQQLTQKQSLIANYERQKQASDRIIQQLKGELEVLRTEKIQTAQELQDKDRLIQELNSQLEVMTNLIGQELTSEIEFPPKGSN